MGILPAPFAMNRSQESFSAFPEQITGSVPTLTYHQLGVVLENVEDMPELEEIARFVRLALQKMASVSSRTFVPKRIVSHVNFLMAVHSTALAHFLNERSIDDEDYGAREKSSTLHIFVEPQREEFPATIPFVSKTQTADRTAQGKLRLHVSQ